MCYDEKVQYLKDKIKGKYELYTSSKNNSNQIIFDIAKIFSIELDETRLDGYIIKLCDVKIPSIEIYDKLKKTTYKADFTSHADLLNYHGSVDSFVRVRSFNPICETESIAYIGDEKPIKKVIRFNKDDKQIVIEKESKHNVTCFGQSDLEIVVRYKNRTNDRRENQERYLNKIYKNKGHGNYFEQIYTYGFPHVIGENDNQDKYWYVDPYVIYGINDLEIRDDKKETKSLRAICFETLTTSNLEDYFPYNISINNYPLIKNNNNISAMIFTGFADYKRNTIEIYKTEKEIKIIYEMVDFQKLEEVKKVQNISIPITTCGPITSEEIYNILEYLNSVYSNHFFDMLSSELINFATKIDVRKNLIEEEPDVLSPKLFYNKSFDEIEQEIGLNKDEYFRIIEEQFYDATHINETKKKENQKIFKK